MREKGYLLRQRKRTIPSEEGEKSMTAGHQSTQNLEGKDYGEGIGLADKTRGKRTRKIHTLNSRRWGGEGD